MEVPLEEIPEEINAVDLVEGTDVEQTETVEEKAAETGVVVSESPEQIQAEEDVGLELGDFIQVKSNRADIETVNGLIYYIDDTRISILEEGKSRKLVVFDMEEDSEGNMTFKEEYEITSIEIQEKRLLPSFVAQRGMAKDMMVETFTAEGDALNTYTIVTVDEERDYAEFKDEAGEVLQLNFAFQGIPRGGSDAPFDVLRVIEPPKKEETVPNEAAPGEIKEEYLDFEFLDDLEAPDDEEEVTGLFQGTLKPEWERIYTDDEQLNDMLRERIRELDPAAQRSTKRIREVTRLVWSMMALRNDVTRYMASQPVGRKPVAFNTLVELLEKTQFPLAKQILQLAKAIYVDHTYIQLPASGRYVKGQDPLTVPDPQIVLQYLHDVLLKGDEYLDLQLKDGLVTAEIQGGGLIRKIPRWITIWQGFFNKFFKVIQPLSEGDDLVDVKHDQDYFRYDLPKDDEQPDTTTGFDVLNADRDTIVKASDLSKVSYSYGRVLGPRQGRYGEGGLTHKIEDADSAEIKGHLIFPLKYLRDLGYIRSGLLAMDIGFGMTPPTIMKDILKSTEIVDFPESSKIISVSFDGSTLGNVEIADWLKGQALYGPGIGALMPPLRSFGLLHAEFTMGQKLVLDDKVSIYRAAVKKMLKEFRDVIKAQREARKPIKTINLLDDIEVAKLISSITDETSGEPILKELLSDFTLRHPSYFRFDVAKFAYMYVYYPDLLINTLAQNPDVAKERLRAERDLYIRGVLDTLEEEKKLQDAGAPPTPNPCQHVKDLFKIRGIENNTERMMAFNKFIRLYKLKKENHWLWCNVGEHPHHLVCEHEYLLLEEFLRPKEKEVLHKELILKFSGGKFGGQYICKQCGQPIADYEYDTSLEFDDQGRPMSGRDVLVDQDQVENEILISAVTRDDEEGEATAEETKARSEEEQKIYLTINELASLTGIFPDSKSYRTMISRVKNALAMVPDRNKYRLGQAALKAQGRVATDYDVFINRIFVSLCASALLIDVQTHIPDYIIRYVLPGCAAPEFTGYPKDPDATKPWTGLEYLACAISSIGKRTEPWENTGYQSIQSSTTRLKEIIFYLKTALTEMSETPDVQQSIVDKKQYLIETFGFESALGRPRDVIPSGFLPLPVVVKKELGTEAQQPVIAESASETEKVRAYIKQAHMYALKFGKYMPGAGFSEASCCYADITKPAEFWDSKQGLPELPPPSVPKGSTGSLLYVKMSPRPLERLFAKADASIMYRLYLRVCFRGPRIGQQHEPGYNNVCPWCEFEFPSDPRLPPPTRRYAKEGGKQKKLDEEYESAIKNKESEEKQALRVAGIENITEDDFEDLLIQVNRNDIIPPMKEKIIPKPLDNLRGMLSILPAPFEDYEEVIRATLVAMEALPPDATRKDLIDSLNLLATKTTVLENEIRTRMGDRNYLNYQELVKLPPQELGEALRTYFLIPFQRILTTQDNETRRFRPVIKPSKNKDFSPEVKRDLYEAYQRHTSYIWEITKDIPKSDKFIKAKIREASDKLSMVIPVFIKILRPTVVRGGALTSTFLQRCIVAGIFAEFIMPNHVPSNEPGVIAPTSAITIPAKLPARILEAFLLKYKQEGLAYTEEQIREMMQDIMEKEKSKIMRDKNEMTPEQRKLDNILQRYGMGKWAIGGTKAIWRYDADHYVSEREQMEAAGITRFGDQVDVYERDGGYDVEQTGADDA